MKIKYDNKSLYDIVFHPVISEKSYKLIDKGKYSFFVNIKANKYLIKLAIEKIFSVKIKSINTLIKKGKKKRNKHGWGKCKNVKKAIVVLKDGKIDIFKKETTI